MDEHRENRLARYNSERGRGIVHTKEWDALMESDQAEWDTEQRASMIAQGGHETSSGVWIIPAPRRRWWQRV